MSNMQIKTYTLGHHLPSLHPVITKTNLLDTKANLYNLIQFIQSDKQAPLTVIGIEFNLHLIKCC